MTDSIRTIEYVLIALMALQLVRLWWRLNRLDDEFWHEQLVKRKERRTLKYTIQRMVWGKRTFIHA